MAIAPVPLARIDFEDPTIWAVLIGWVMSVTLHEFAHGLVAWWGGDYTIRERGGLTLNPFQYVDPLMSLVLPVVFLMMGGIPLPGGATYVRRDLLRSRGWNSAVSAAGPAMNLLLFGLLAIPLMPGFGWINLSVSPTEWTTAQKFVSSMCFLQLLSVILNLVPVPPLDGFGIISPYLPDDVRVRLTTPPLSSMLFFGYFLLLWQAPGFMGMIDNGMQAIMGRELYAVAGGGFFAVFYAR
ncbi:MAG TPA: site-2 protease family protein [Tepidisphaeraceae bacterium]|jgi:Zn-dependent protease